jgi:hypothetical protein
MQRGAVTITRYEAYNEMREKAVSDIADTDDVTKFYNLFLRRNPENQTVLSENVGRKISDVFSRFLNSAEFSEKVLGPLASEEALWSAYCGSTSLPGLCEWATSALPIGRDFWKKLAPSVSWERFYLHLLLDTRTQEFSPKLSEPCIRHVLDLRRNETERSVPSLSIAGCADHANVEEVRGWCANESALEDRLTVEIFMGTMLIGAVPCDEYRRDIQDLLGGTGCYGFTFKFSASHLSLYQTNHPISAREQTTALNLRCAFFERSGLLDVLAPHRHADEQVTEGQAKTLFRRKASGLLSLFGRKPIDFSCAGKPEVSVIMVAHNQFALTLMALGSLRANYSGDLELILVDSGSTDEVQRIGRYVSGGIFLSFPTNIGFLRACNAALPFATADSMLFLNNDVELAPGAVAAALSRLGSDPTIGAVGGKVIRTNGLLQEAGNIVWRDGTTTGYLRDGSPLAPEATFVRDVDFLFSRFSDSPSQLAGYDRRLRRGARPCLL